MISWKTELSWIGKEEMGREGRRKVDNIIQEKESKLESAYLQGKGNASECTSYRSINLLSISEKVYGRIVTGKSVLTLKISQIMNNMASERLQGVCTISALGAISEKYLERIKDLFLVFMDLEKAHDTVDCRTMWRGWRGIGSPRESM